MSDGDEVRIVDDAGEPVAPGEIGELQVRGPYTIRGYYRLAEHNATAFTADGFIAAATAYGAPRTTSSSKARDKDQINRGGEKVSAEEVENLLLAHPLVHDAAVVAMPDPLLGERTRARSSSPVRPHRPGCCETLPARLRLAAFKIPDRIEFMPRFPETGIGKTSKKSLRDRCAASCRRRPHERAADRFDLDPRTAPVAVPARATSASHAGGTAIFRGWSARCRGTSTCSRCSIRAARNASASRA